MAIISIGPNINGWEKTAWKKTFYYCSDRDIRSQLARQTHLLAFIPDVKSCIVMYIISVLFVLFLLVMCIWIDLQVLQIWDFGSTFKSRRAKPSLTKPS